MRATATPTTAACAQTPPKIVMQARGLTKRYGQVTALDGADFELRAGEILGQASLAITPDDTPQTLAARVLELEHELYPRCLAQFARNLH